MKILNKIKTFFYAIEFATSIAITAISMWLFKSKYMLIRRSWSKSQRIILGYDLEIIGKANTQANLIMINHQSILDIVVMEEIYPGNLCWVSKKEIGDIPIIGKILSVPKMIAIDRKDPRSLLKILKEARERINEGRVISIFPEGSRGDGDKLLEFQSGAKIIVSKLNLKVQPVVVVNSKKVLDSKNFSINKGKIKIIYMDLVDTTDKDWLETSRNNMQKILDSNL